MTKYEETAIFNIQANQSFEYSLCLSVRERNQAALFIDQITDLLFSFTDFLSLLGGGLVSRRNMKTIKQPKKNDQVAY